MPISRNTTTIVGPDYRTPPFPSLYWLIGPPHVVQPAYLYHIKDIWRFTFFWTLIIFEAAHLLVAFYAVSVVWWAGRNGSLKPGKDMDGEPKSRQNLREAPGLIVGWKKLKILWIVPVIYGTVAGVESALAGSVVGLMLGAVYNAGGFKMSTWMPFVWSIVSVLILILSSFSIQGGL